MEEGGGGDEIRGGGGGCGDGRSNVLIFTFLFIMLLLFSIRYSGFDASGHLHKLDDVVLGVVEGVGEDNATEHHQQEPNPNHHQDKPNREQGIIVSMVNQHIHRLLGVIKKQENGGGCEDEADEVESGGPFLVEGGDEGIK